MSAQPAWLWDRKITEKRARVVLADAQDSHFLSLAGLLLSRMNEPRVVFKDFLQPVVFMQNWRRIKQQMRKDDWNDPRIEFWQAVYERLREKYKSKDMQFEEERPRARPQNELCASIGTRIKDMRKQNGMTQKDLAKKLKVSQQIISRIEQGRENVSVLTLQNVARGLGAELRFDLLTPL